MFQIKKGGKPEDNYKLMVQAIRLMLNDEKDLIANLSMISAIINVYLDRINWAGFYLMKEGELVLGPFQGLPACIRIALGKGVCGKAAAEMKALVVPDVDEFPGHIACDSASRSEIVLPLIKNGEIFGVLDIDSPETERFGELEEKYLTLIAGYINEFLDK